MTETDSCCLLKYLLNVRHNHFSAVLFDAAGVARGSTNA
jgi:hypothetical protein